MKKVNSEANNFLDDIIYYYCTNCKENINKFFCYICNKNICEKCYKICKFNKHLPQNLEENNFKNNINTIKMSLNNLIIPIIRDEKIIKGIISYIDKYIVNHGNTITINNDFALTHINKKKEDILLIHQIISKDYINYFHYKNIEKLLVYLNQEYCADINNKYEGFAKKLLENGDYYIGEFKNGLRNGKGILYYKHGILIYFGNFFDNKFEGCGNFQYDTYDY